MTQCEMILNFMEKYGKITPAEAFTELGCYRLAARIAELERKGHNIVHIPESTVNRYGQKRTYMSYKLAS